jgi:hypothetical protein
MWRPIVSRPVWRDSDVQRRWIARRTKLRDGSFRSYRRSRLPYLEGAAVTVHNGRDRILWDLPHMEAASSA